jgi:4-amino-4-deoxy-L-arabinose transferase-like glycosyltransferase
VTAATGTRPHSWIILTLALATRSLTLLFVMQRFPHMWLYSRGIELGTLAQSLVAGHGLSSPFGGSTGPTALLSPGYPVVIALCFRIFGSFSFQAAMAVMVLQLLFSLATVLLVIQVAGQCFGPRAANLAGTFWALSLPLIWMPTIFWETCLSTLLLLGMVALSLHTVHRRRPILWPVVYPLMGAYCGLAALVNPALLLTLFALLIWVAWQTRKSDRLSPLLALLVFGLVYAPWPIRNARALGAFIPLRSTVAFELWMGNHAGATGFLDESLFPIFNRGEYDQYAALGEVAYMRVKSALAQEYIRAHAGEFLRLSTVRFLRYWTGTGSRYGSLVFTIHAVLTTLGGVIGLGRLWQRRSFSLAGLFLLPLILFPLPYYITHAEFRYRLVVDPLLTILAAYGVSGSRAS